MKRLILYTINYEGELRNFAKNTAGLVKVNWAKWHEKKRVFGLCLSWEYAYGDGVIEELMYFLEDIAVTENPIYRNSAKLRNMAQNLRYAPVHKRERKRLKGFLRENGILHLEGYTTFRMEEYRDRLDMMTYSLIKKLNMSNRE